MIITKIQEDPKHGVQIRSEMQANSPTPVPIERLAAQVVNSHINTAFAVMGLNPQAEQTQPAEQPTPDNGEAAQTKSA